MSGLQITQAAIERITAEVAAWGARRVETGGFVLAGTARHDGAARILALAGSAGIVRRPRLLTISGAAIGQLFDWASEQELHICAQFHSHAGPAFLSQTDIDHGFAVEGFITAVVPSFAAPPPRPERWGWWQCHRGSWQPWPAPALVAGPAQVIHFDERGIRAA